MELHYRRPDGSFVATVGGLPYHIVEGDPLFEAAQANGSDLPLEPVPETPPPTLDDFRLAIQWRIDETARQRGYDSGVTCSSYIGSTVPAWAAEAAAFVSYRDAVWAYAYAEMAKVENDKREMPTIADILSELPSVNWP